MLSVGIRIIFMVIFLNNIPFLFYPGKLSVLNALMEYRECYFSKVLKNQIVGCQGNNGAKDDTDAYERFDNDTIPIEGQPDAQIKHTIQEGLGNSQELSQDQEK